MVILVAIGLLLSADAYAQTLIVGNKREHTVSFIDLKTGLEVARTETGKAPHEIAVSPDGKLAAVVSYRSSGYIGKSLHVFDVESGATIRDIDLGKHRAPHGLKWIAGTNRVIVTTEASQDVALVNIDTGEVVDSIKTAQSQSHMVALSPEAKTAYVANIGSNSFTVLDLVEMRKIIDIEAGSGTEAIAVSPDGSNIWVGNNRSRSVMVFNAESLKKLGTIKTDGVPIRVEISPNGKYASVSEADLDQLSIYDAATYKKIATVDLKDAGGITPVTQLYSPNGERLWVATTNAAKVFEIDTIKWTIARSFDAGAGSDGLGYSRLSTIPRD